MVVCCALPALISAGVLAAAGTVLVSPFVIATAVAVLGGAVVDTLRRHRHGQTCPDARGRTSR